MNLKNKIILILATPWKLNNEMFMYLWKPITFLYLKLNQVRILDGQKFYGLPMILRHKDSLIKIGSNFENRNWWFSNPIGINHKTIFCTWNKNAQILIGNNVGISGGSIVSAQKVQIGDGTIIGANCLIADTDFHPINSVNRRYEKKNVKSFPIKIGNNVFIGTNSIILKGVTIPDNTVIPAGVVVRFDEQKGYTFK